jgi:predicted RNase H-like HicB family nuclease
MKTTLLRYHVIIQKEGRGYIAYVPTLGISDFGKTVTRAKQNVARAIACHIEGLVKTETEVPAPDTSEFYLSQTEVTIPGNFEFAAY